MTYEAQISFTLDTICPWTYLAKKRSVLFSLYQSLLDEALRRFRASDEAKDVTFTVKYFPYQLYPGATKEPESRYDWYKRSRYGDSEEKMKTYIALMSGYGATAGIKFKFGGTVSNTMDAHRVIQHFQEEKGPETVDKIINSLYLQFFEHEQNPSSDETLLKATSDAGIPESEAKPFIEDKNDGMLDVKNLVRQQAGNGIDSVPTIMFEGKRRDIELVGAKEVEEYEKTLRQIVKESK
ncbi:hypothetical protein H2200_010067 [Cladophialophora chaetospira]|uniref:DSBA-like thioredoxin domain-containing protein n=1 Tax=Cladophialophora chaetospira TaxID=386627 RepID=A0AA38X2A0_9EURO|nr:hypothetical protein H2200_010067 [Cladophialophora chaetospira]